MSRLADVLSLENVRSAYERTGLKPARRVFRLDDCACAMVAVATDGGAPPGLAESWTYFAKQQDLRPDDVFGFLRGFDGHEAGKGWLESEVEAHAHGGALAAALFGPPAPEAL